MCSYLLEGLNDIVANNKVPESLLNYCARYMNDGTFIAEQALSLFEI